MEVQNVLQFDGSFLKYEGLKAVYEYSTKEKSEISVIWHKTRYNDLVLKFTFKSYFDGKLYGAPRYDEIITDEFDYALDVINAIVLDYSPIQKSMNVDFKYVTIFFKESSTGKWVKKLSVMTNKEQIWDYTMKNWGLKSAPMKSTRKQQKDGKKMYGQYKGMVGDVKQMGKQFSKNFNKLI